MNASILDYLKANGEQLDVDIAAALRIPMPRVKTLVEQLSVSGDVICCHVTRFIDGKKIEGTSCRLSCDLPAPSRGRKPGGKKDVMADIFVE
ncbi:MAG: ArsR family transcriptional regulator [Candidatus Accumulibacter sp.]|nr:ArsR family transcriptional regulator [Accumulibacter sp.]